MTDLPPDLLSLAALGTGRQPGPLPLPGGPLGHLLAQTDSTPEGRLLLLAAGLDLQQRAGLLPRQTRSAALPLCPPDQAPPFSRAALRRLTLMLQGAYRELLPLWLEQAAGRGLRAPAEALPLLLDAGYKTPELQPLLLPLLGQRGPWLAAVAGHKSWGWARLEGVEEIWQTGSTEQRLALCTRLRLQEPARARALLELVWQQEGYRGRRTLLLTFRHNLSPADEPFLEAALDDRSGTVRREAASLLALLPGSAFMARMEQRALAHLGLARRGLRRRHHLVVAHPPPDSLPPGWQRDGLEAGDRLWQQVLSYVSPSTLAAAWDLSLSSLYELYLGSAEETAGIAEMAGWASRRTGDHDFALLLVGEALPELSSELLDELVPALPQEALETAAFHHLNRSAAAFDHRHPALRLLLAHRRPWGGDLTQAFLDSLSRYLKRGRVRPDHNLRAALRQFVLYMPPEMEPAILQTLDTQTAAPRLWQEIVDETHLYLAFRREMEKEIR